MEDEAAPLLVYTHGKSRRRQFQTLCTMSPLPPNNKSSRQSLPELRGKAIIGSHHGWLILQSTADGTLFSLFNPVTSQALHLPPLQDAPDDEDVDTCTLTSPPDHLDDNINSTCVLYVYFSGVGLMFSIRPMKLDCGWAAQRLQPHDDKTAPIVNIVTLNGVIYGCHENGEWIYSAKGADGVSIDDLDSLPVTSPNVRDVIVDSYFEFLHRYLVESCGHLYSVALCITAEDQRMIAMKVDEVISLQKAKFEEVHSLDGRAFFLGKDCCTWCWASDGDKPEDSGARVIRKNCLYFFLPLTYGAVFTRNFGTLYEYDLHDHSLTALCPCPSLVSPHDRPVWLMTEHQRCKLLHNEEVKNCSIAKEDASSLELSGNDANEEGKFSQLPSDLLVFISKFIHLFDYANFRAGCKSFRTAAPRPLWKTNNKYPLFLSFKNGARMCELRDPSRLDFRSGTLQLLPPGFSRVVFCSNGWLLALVGVNTIHFLNPFTREGGEFPDGATYGFKSICFSTNPKYPRCLAVAIYYCNDEVIFGYIQSGDDGSWTDRNWELDCYGHKNRVFKASSSPPIFCKGAFHYLDSDGYLGVFRFNDGKSCWKTYDKPCTKEGNLRSFNLVECAGNVYSVFIIGDHGECVQVFKFDDFTKKWVGVNHLDGHSFFVSRTSSCSIAMREVNSRDRIYLPVLKGNDIVFYSLQTRRYHVLGLEGSLADLWYTREPINCCWI